MKIARMMKMKCKICGQEFTDGWEHALTKGDDSPFLVPIDKAHAEALEKFRQEGREGDCPLCDGHVKTFSYGSPGSPSWETICGGCNYLFDED